MHFEKLVRQIEKVKKNQRPIVAVSGFSGSGKTTLCDRLAEYFGINFSQVVRIDCLYSQNPDGTHFLDQVDWETLSSILKKARQEKRLQYQGRGYRGGKINVDEELPEVVLVEGIRLLQPRFREFFDLTVWIDCPQEVALERAKKRDRAQGETEEEVLRWDTHWGRLDKAYFDELKPEIQADFLYRAGEKEDL